MKFFAPKRLVQLTHLSALALPLCLMHPALAQSQTTQYYNCAVANGCVTVDEISPKSDYAATDNPIVLAHGALGWNRLLGFLDYFNGIPETLAQHGADVFSTKTSSVNSTEVRGEQLLQQVQTITAITGKEQVNIIGHSHGGLDARYVAGVAPNLVASVTSVASPHKGTAFADWMQEALIAKDDNGEFIDDELIAGGEIVAGLVEFIGDVMDVGSGIGLDGLNGQSATSTVASLTTEAVSEFNQSFPAPLPDSYCGETPDDHVMNDVGYYSFSGVGQLTNVFDISDYVFTLTSLTFDGDPNDGLVASCSSRLGWVIRDDYAMNHLDTVNHFVGLTPWFEPNPLSLYRAQVNRLKVEGY